MVAVFTGHGLRGPATRCRAPGRPAGVDNFVNTPRALEVDRSRSPARASPSSSPRDRYAAEDALALIEVDYEPLPAVVDVEKAAPTGAPQLHENAPGNIVHGLAVRRRGGTDRALGEADVVVRQQLVNQRLIPTPMETRGAVAQYDAGDRRVHGLDDLAGAARHAAAHDRVRLRASPRRRCAASRPHVGGGFGTKIFLYPEYVLVAALAEKVGRPVKWIETRSENYIATTHGRDHVTDLEVGAKRDGTITALKVHTYANLGGHPLDDRAGHPDDALRTHAARAATGSRTSTARCEGVLHQHGAWSTPTAARAGPRRPTSSSGRSTWSRAELGLDPVEVRRKNFIPPDDFPYDPAGSWRARRTTAATTRRRSTGRSRWSATRTSAREQAEAAAAGPATRHRLLDLRRDLRRRAVGLDRRVGEGWGAGLWESANVRVHLTGKVVVTTGSQSHGPGPRDDVRPDRRRRARASRSRTSTSQHSDTQGTPFGYGTYGSRSAAVGGVAVYNSLQRIKEKARRIAAHMLEAAVEDIVYEDGRRFTCKGSPDTAKTIQEIAVAGGARRTTCPHGEEPFLDDTAYYDPPNCTFPFGTHIAMVEVDAETGEVDARSATSRSTTSGKVINPMIVDGQVHGGIAQGVGAGALGGRGLRRGRPAPDRHADGLRRPEGRVLPVARARAAPRRPPT